MAAQWAIEATYSDVEDLIFDRCWAFKWRYGGDFYNWLSEANLIFMIAYYEYDRSRGACFSTYLQYLLDRRLVDHVRKAARRAKYEEKRVSLLPKESTRQVPRLEQLLKEVSSEAKEVMELLIDTPADIKLALIGRPKREPEEAKWRECIVEFLGDLGWSVGQIKDTFKEIQEALC